MKGLQLKIIGAAFLLLLLVGMGWHITYLQGEVKEQEAKIAADNGTIEQFQEDQKRSSAAKRALETQVSAAIADCSAYRKNEGKIHSTYHGTRPLRNVPATNSTEVMDNEGSAASADLLNGLFDSVR